MKRHSKCPKCDGSGLMYARYWGQGAITCDCSAGAALRAEYADLDARHEQRTKGNSNEGKDEKVGVGQ